MLKYAKLITWIFNNEEWYKEVLENEIKALIVEVLELEDVTPSDISTTKPLFGDGLGLNSIDSLEIIMALEKKYCVEIDYRGQHQKHLYSVSTISDFVMNNYAEKISV